MSIHNMKAIEYNSLMTIVKLLQDRVPSIAHEYNIKNGTIEVIPAYPSDLTTIKKPSIIVRKVDTQQSKVGFGNVLGQMYDNQLSAYVDVLGKYHDMLIQFDVVSANNTDRALLESIIADDLFNAIAMNEENNTIDFYDFTGNITSPTIVGNLKLISDPYIQNIVDKDSDNDFYVGVIRQSFKVLQTIIPETEFVDLSKWIKQTYRIVL